MLMSGTHHLFLNRVENHGYWVLPLSSQNCFLLEEVKRLTWGSCSQLLHIFA